MRSFLTILLFVIPLISFAQTEVEGNGQKTLKLRSKSKVGGSGNFNFAATVGGGAHYYIPKLSKDWTETDGGLGLNMAYYASASLVWNVKEKMAVTLTSGKVFSGIEKRFITEGDLQYTSQETLDYIPVQLGLRLYLGRTFYFEPQIGTSFMDFKTKTSEEHPFGEYEEIQKKNKFFGGLGMGLDIRKNNLAIDVSSFIHYTENRESFGFTDPISYAGLRLQIGYSN